MKNTLKSIALTLLLCLLTACSTVEENSSQPQTTAAQGTTASETTVTTTEKTTPAEAAPKPAEPTAEPVSEPEKPAEEEIVPLEISPQSIPNDPEVRVTECYTLAALATLGASSGIEMDFWGLFAIWDDYSSIDDHPEPNKTMVHGWGCCPNAIIENIGDSNSYRELINITELTGCPTSELYENIDNGIPVMVWVSKELKDGKLLAEADGVKMFDSNETVVLVGYSDNFVMVWSPFQNDFVTYEKKRFEYWFEELGSFALTITKK